ncbi:MAG TPA: type II secretion system protein GspJ [Oceanospirillales bacterium]|nr:type II secretion system protein GspJ [Oceanospirillales bacterium]
MALTHKPHIKQQTAMTLLEVLVAMTLMVVISAIAFASLNGLIDAKIHTDEIANNIRQQLLLSQQLNQDIHGLIKRKARDEFGQTKAAIIGAYSILEFTRNGHANPLNQPRSDLQRVQWLLRDNQLLRRSYDYIDVGSNFQWRERPYIQDVQELNINYINVAGLESRRWPLENNRSRLKFIQFNVVLLDGTSINYQLRPVL